MIKRRETKNLILERMREKGFRVMDVAEKLGVSRATIHNYLYKDGFFTKPTKLKRLCEMLDIPKDIVIEAVKNDFGVDLEYKWEEL